MEDAAKRSQLLGSVRAFLAEISIEPVLFLYYAGIYSRSVVRENLKLERICRITLQYGEEDCASLNDGRHEHMQTETQKLDSVFTFYEKVASTVVPLLLISFLASWSDRRGRKIPLVLSFFGDCLYCFIYLLESLFPSWPPQVLLVASFLQSIGGGIMMLLMAAYSFMADKTNAKSRTFRMTIMNSIMHLGGPLGTSLGAWVFAARGYAWVFGLSLLISVTCLVLVIFIVGDKSPESDANGGKEAPRSPWNPRNVVDLFRACFRRRPGRGRVHLILLMLLMLCWMSATPHNLYLWARRVYLWDENQYSLYLTINQVMEQVSSLVTAPLLHKMAAHDCSMGAGASFLVFLKFLALGLTTNPSQWWVLYIFVVIPLSIPTAAIRGLMSKICDADEVGKVFSMLAILEVLWPLADSALFTAVYSTTLEFYPSYEHLLDAFFGAFLFCGFLGLRLSLEQVRTRVGQEPVEEESAKES